MNGTATKTIEDVKQACERLCKTAESIREKHARLNYAVAQMMTVDIAGDMELEGVECGESTADEAYLALSEFQADADRLLALMKRAAALAEKIG